MHTVTPLPFDAAPTPATAFPALNTPLPADDAGACHALDRLALFALSTLERSMALSAKLAGLERLVLADGDE